MKFYVYEWFIKNTGEVFYVGKGCKNRYKVRKHNKLFNSILESNECESRIIKEFENEKDAFDYEYEMINKYREINQCKANIYNGGMGGTTEWWTPELRQKYSEKNVMKSDCQRKRMSTNNPMKRKDVQNKVKLYKQIPVIIGNKEYKSKKDAINDIGISYDLLDNWIKKGFNRKGELCYEKGKQKVFEVNEPYIKTTSKPIVYDGKIYPSAVNLAKKLSLHYSTVSKWALKGYTTSGIECRYLNDLNLYEYKPTVKGEKLRKPIIVNGQYFCSVAEAEKQLGLKKGRLAPYIAKNRKNMKFICEYVNQQPSTSLND